MLCAAVAEKTCSAQRHVGFQAKKHLPIFFLALQNSRWTRRNRSIWLLYPDHSENTRTIATLPGPWWEFLEFRYFFWFSGISIHLEVAGIYIILYIYGILYIFYHKYTQSPKNSTVTSPNHHPSWKIDCQIAIEIKQKTPLKTKDPSSWSTCWPLPPVNQPHAPMTCGRRKFDSP